MSEVIVAVGTYLRVFVALMFLWVAFFDLGVVNAFAALTIAIIKASIVALFFMHLRYSGKLTWVVVGAAIFWLGILFTLSLSDYLTRMWGGL
jgi:cytochrome c oxidase subunit 4